MRSRLRRLSSAGSSGTTRGSAALGSSRARSAEACWSTARPVSCENLAATAAACASSSSARRLGPCSVPTRRSAAARRSSARLASAGSCCSQSAVGWDGATDCTDRCHSASSARHEGELKSARAHGFERDAERANGDSAPDERRLEPSTDERSRLDAVDENVAESRDSRCVLRAETASVDFRKPGTRGADLAARWDTDGRRAGDLRRLSGDAGRSCARRGRTRAGALRGRLCSCRALLAWTGSLTAENDHVPDDSSPRALHFRITRVRAASSKRTVRRLGADCERDAGRRRGGGSRRRKLARQCSSSPRRKAWCCCELPAGGRWRARRQPAETHSSGQPPKALGEKARKGERGKAVLG